MKYLSRREIEVICSNNSMCRDVFNEFKKKYPYLLNRITDIFSTGFVYPRGYVRYEINYKIYDFVLED